jgi:hypothetical protein
MGKSMTRGIFADGDNQAIEKLSLKELNTEIARCIDGYEFGGTTAGQKAFFKRLVWLEKERERIHKVEAKKRVFRK